MLIPMGGRYSVDEGVVIEQVGTYELGSVTSVGAGVITMNDGGFHVLLLLNDDSTPAIATVLFNGVSPTGSINSAGSSAGGDAEIHWIDNATAGDITITFGTTRNKKAVLYRLTGATVTGLISGVDGSPSTSVTLNSVPEGSAIFALACDVGTTTVPTISAADTTQDAVLNTSPSDVILVANTGIKVTTGNLPVSFSRSGARSGIAAVCFPPV